MRPLEVLMGFSDGLVSTNQSSFMQMKTPAESIILLWNPIHLRNISLDPIEIP